ncbi:transcriptional regulator ATRX isoform X2 [Camponotus floridanus]|uniref:transcriptional regulator ATRX isoform X2 n=1 Tax=Camponotus floridanus TaxID=104421 RepID=UPI000DC6BE90|nr:transcriptional regulator ATRX isoform X2 [Camponotus floridanus]
MSSEREIKATEQELAYREKYFHDIRAVKDKQIACTSCGNELSLESKQIFSHPLMGILQCETCWNHFKEIDAAFEDEDEDEFQKYCYICGDDKKLYECGNKDCVSAFCKKCIKRNATMSLLHAEKKDWKCFTCNPKPIWDLRAVCAAVMDTYKKGNRRSTNKIERRVLPSQIQKIKKAREVQKSLRMLCDSEEDDSSSDNTFVTLRAKQKIDRQRLMKQNANLNRQKEIVEVNLTDSSGNESLFSANDSIFYNQDKQRKSRKDQKTKSIQKRKISKNKISSDSDDNSIDLSTNKTIKQKRTSKSNISTKRIISNRNSIYSDSESDKNVSTNKASNIAKNLSNTGPQNKKEDTASYDAKATKHKAKKYQDSTSESEDEDITDKKQNSKKQSTNRTTSYNSSEEKKRKNKHNKSSKKHLSTIQEGESDASSSKEFQKKKLQKVNHNKFTRRKLADLETDYTKLVAEEDPAIESKENNNDQIDMNLDNAKECVSNCKAIVSNLQKYINSMEQLYGEQDEEQFMLKMIKKINKLWPNLQKVQKNLTTFYVSKSSKKNLVKRLPKEVNDNEQSLKETNVHENHTTSENKARNSGNEQGGSSKNVSECDSEEIFSGDESRRLQKEQTIQNNDTSNMENNVNANKTNEKSNEDKELIDSSENEDNANKDDVDLQNNLSNSPVLNTSTEKKIKNAERSIKTQLFSECINNNDTPLTIKIKIKDKDKDIDSNNKQTKSDTDVPSSEIEIEDSPLRNERLNRKTILQNSIQNDSANTDNIINESMDLFDTSYLKTGENETEVPEPAIEIATETNCDNPESSSKIKSLDTCLQDKISDKNDRASLSLRDNEEENLFDQNTPKKVTFATREDISDNLEELDISGKTNIDIDSLDDAEALAKKSLLELDSDLDDILDANVVTKSTEGLNIDDLNRIGLDNKVEDDDFDVNSTSTLILSSFLKKTNTDDKDKTKVENKNDNQANGKPLEETSSLNDDAKAEEAAKKALLESNSDESLSLSSLDSGENENKKTKSNSSRENARSKQALLASSNTESSSPEPTVEVEASDRSKNLNERAKQALLASSNTESSSPEPIEVEANDRSKNLNSKRNRESDDDSIVSRVKRKRLKLNRNSWNDKKLRMLCEVRLERLSRKDLRRYSHALQKSREYLEQKAFKSLINLSKLEKTHKKNAKKDSDSSTDDDTSSKVSKSLNKQKGKQTTEEESLMDHLKKIENGDVSTLVEMDSSSDESIKIQNVDVSVSNEALISEANRIAKENLLNSSDSNEKEVVLGSDDDVNNDDKNENSEEKKKKHDKKSEEKTLKQDDDKKEKNDKSNWRRNKLLTMRFSDTDSDAEKEKWEKKQEKLTKKSEENNSDSNDEEKRKSKKKKTRRRIIDSDSDVIITDCSIDSDNSSKASSTKQSSTDWFDKKEKEKLRGKRRKRGENASSDTDSSLAEKKPKPKRKRIKKVASDSDSSIAEIKNSQDSTPGKSGRKNIRKVLKDKQVADDTKLAAKEEEERLKRIAERQALYNEMYEMRLAGEEKVEKLVLDFDTETKKELVSVHEELVKRLKPHQAQGIKFMWDACFESLERVKTTSGSGCIIAHCMGLGKTLQVIALTHTLLSHEETGVKTVLIVCPLSTVLNWLNEYRTWLNDMDDIEVYELTKFKKNFERKYQLQRWQKTGGVMIIGYEMFRNLTGANKNIRKNMKQVIDECLVDPGADLIVCDEGHLLKNEDTALSKCMRRVKTLRRIVLTGTPLQNNLIEYHCMVQFVKPNLLGTKKEFLNRFVNPITNGQFDDSTAYDVKLMKKRAHVLHKMLEGSVQRFDYSVLTPFLPPKQEYVIFVRLTDTQIKMYQYYLENLARRSTTGAGGTLFADFQALQRIWTHPIVLRLNAEKIEKANEKKDLSDSEGSLVNFINDDSDSGESNSSNSSSDSDVEAIDDPKENISKRRTRNNPGEEEPEEEAKEETREAEWWSQFVQPEHFEDMRVSAKLLLFFGILKESEQIGDKVLLFSQSLYSLTLIEEFLRKIDDETQNNACVDTLDNHTGSWSLGLDYFRLDGQTSAENRNIWCKIFNKPTNTRARLFLISTRAGGLGINLTAANRVIIFDASWNPSHDVQSIFRIYRFGQKKPCYIYRFLAAGTMEEKIYNRQVTKLSLSCRVVDEQQIERHYSNHNLNELYTFEAYNNAERPTLNLPKDRLLAEIFLKYKDVVENYHEHDSLLENKAEEELDEEERKQAWLEYEEEKKGKPPINPMMNVAYQNNLLLQQYNMMMNAGQTSLVSQDSLHFQYDNLEKLIRKDYPNATPEQQKIMTNRALMEMYNYWEKQATLYSKQPVRNVAPILNFQQRPMVVPPTAGNSNAHQQISQLNQLLTSGQSGNYVIANKPAQPNVAQRTDLVLNPFTYRTTSSNNAGGKPNDDIIEIIPTTSNAGVSNVQVAIQPTDISKNQEE